MVGYNTQNGIYSYLERNLQPIHAYSPELQLRRHKQKPTSGHLAKITENYRLFMVILKETTSN